MRAHKREDMLNFLRETWTGEKILISVSKISADTFVNSLNLLKMFKIAHILSLLPAELH